MKQLLYIIILLSLIAVPSRAQQKSIYTGLTLEIIQGDTVLVAETVPVFVFPRKIDPTICQIGRQSEKSLSDSQRGQSPVGGDGEAYGYAQNRTGTKTLHQGHGAPTEEKIHPRSPSDDLLPGEIIDQTDRPGDRTYLLRIG